MNQKQRPENYGLSIVIPCLNEEVTLGKAISTAQSAISELAMQGEVVVADNGSTDQSKEIALRSGARLIDVSTKGYGAALDAGIRSAKYSWVGFADADLSYPFEAFKDLVPPLASDSADFVLGSRLNRDLEKGAMPLLNRYLGTPVLSFLIRLIYRIPVSDCNSGIRAMKLEKYHSLGLTCPGMEFASEMLIRVSQRELRYVEVPIKFRVDQRGRRPHLRRWRDGWRHLRFIISNASSSFVVMAPAAVGSLALTVAFALSFFGNSESMQQLHYHSAFLAIAASIPPLMFASSAILVKLALNSSGQVESRLVRAIMLWSENSGPIVWGVVAGVLALAQAGFIAYRWVANDFGALSELPAIIRVMVYSILSTTLFTLDIGIGILRLVPFRNPSDK